MGIILQSINDSLDYFLTKCLSHSSHILRCYSPPVPAANSRTIYYCRCYPPPDELQQCNFFAKPKQVTRPLTNTNSIYSEGEITIEIVSIRFLLALVRNLLGFICHRFTLTDSRSYLSFLFVPYFSLFTPKFLLAFA